MTALLAALSVAVSVPMAPASRRAATVIARVQHPQIDELASPDVSQPGHHDHWISLSFAQGYVFQGIAGDPTGPYVWVADMGHNAMVRIGMDLSVESLRLVTASGAFTPGYFTFGGDGTMYIGGCVESSCNIIGVLSRTRKHFSVYRIPSGDGPGTSNRLVFAPMTKDVWFVETAHVGKMNSNGVITEFPSLIPQPGPNIAVAPNGRVWYDGALPESGVPEPEVAFLNSESGRARSRYWSETLGATRNPSTRWLAGWP